MVVLKENPWDKKAATSFSCQIATARLSRAGDVDMPQRYWTVKQGPCPPVFFHAPGDSE